MKKKIFILIVLFALPVSIYILFATAAHNFARLPIRTEHISDLNNFTHAEDDTISYANTLTVLCFYGNKIKDMQGNAFNLNEKIYSENYIYKDFQIVVLAEEGTESQAENLKKELHKFAGLNMSKWKFAFGSAQDIKSVFNSMKTDIKLDKNLSTPYVFIVDKKGNLRGQKDEDDPNVKTLYGYDTRTIAALNNKMVDDVKILLAEYRLKMKKKEDDITTYKDEEK